MGKFAIAARHLRHNNNLESKPLVLGVAWILLLSLLPGFARQKDATQYGAGLIVNIPYPESEVSQVVQDVVQNGIIRGTKEYNKDEYVGGAEAAPSTKVFKEWTEGGKVFYKVRYKALDPRNFKDSGDVGTLAVRYVLQPQGDKNTVLRIDAIFVEDFRHTAHASNGSVESGEYKDIHDRLESIESMKEQAVEAAKEKQSALQKPQSAPEVHENMPAAVLGSNASETGNGKAPQTLAEHVQDLRRQLERHVKAPGAPLKSAPFHTASTLQALPPGTEILVVVTTPYWFGVETHDGQHGWMLRDDLEQLP